MKKCTKCKHSYPLEDFPPRKSAKDGRHYYCKFCMRLLMKDSYAKNPEAINKRNKDMRIKLMKLVNEFRMEHPCICCKESEISCLDFHHVDSSLKESTVSELIGCKSEKRLLEEMKKCVILCANCHRKFHAGKIILPIQYGLVL